MSYDRSTAAPGPMGWGERTEMMATRYDNERRAFDALANAQPRAMARRAPRTPNAALIALLRERMALDGQVSGFRCSYIEEVAFGAFLRWLAQLIGSCVASGNMRGWTWRALIEVLLLNDPEELFGTKNIGPQNVALFAPFSYRAGRKFAGINGNSDGSYCSAHMRGQVEIGCLPCSASGLTSDAFPEPQDKGLYRRWGANDTLMNQFKNIAGLYRVLEAEKVTSATQSRETVNEGFKPLMVCSSWAFKPDYAHPTWRDRNGNPIWIYKRNRLDSWAHNMTIDGHVVIESDEEYTWVINSWGMEAHKNGHGFPIRTEEYDDWCRNSEQMSIGEIDLADNPAPIGG